ncbi:hypothetical protein OFC87_32560, partial [Escherichia coli]|nr:hypothetical protein [Escherichia coli]
MIGYVPSPLVNIFGNYNLSLLHAVAQTLDELSQEALNATKSGKDAHQALFELAFCYHDFAQEHPFRWQLVF